MESRIEINGVWYVREDQLKKEIEFNVIQFDGRVYESELYCFEVTRIHNDDGTPYVDCSIEFTDKREEPFVKDHLDNPNWFLGVLENNPESMKEANDMMCKQGIEEFRCVVQDLIDIKWVKK